MPSFNQQWENMSCAVCTGRFDLIRLPCSLTCSHTICAPCLTNFRDGTVTKCPLDQTDQKMAIGLFPVNTALLELLQLKWKNSLTVQDRLRICLKVFQEDPARRNYLTALEKMENIAAVMANTEILNKPLQRKLLMLLQCQILLEDGRSRALKAARSVCERIVVELILQHQNQQQLTTHLWSAVRARGCQFLGPAMQEEVLKLVLLALESGSALSRKVLVMFIVQKLKPMYPQASKTSVGHVVQLLYRASCFKVCKRDGDSSLMELKEEFRTYDALRREHDAQVIQIAQESGLRIAPEQWSSLLYGDQQHKSPMQSIIDKLQTTQFFAQSVQELLVAVQRSGDPDGLIGLNDPLNYFADLDINAAESTSIHVITLVLTNLLNILVIYLRFMITVQTGRDPTHLARSGNRVGDEYHLMNGNGIGLNGGTYCTLPPQFIQQHQALGVTRSLPHGTLGSILGPSSLLADSMSVMDLNRTVYRTPENSNTNVHMVHPLNSVATQQLSLSFPIARPASRQHSLPFPHLTSQQVPLSNISRLNMTSGIPTQLGGGTAGPSAHVETVPNFSLFRQPVTASASWSGSGFHGDLRVPQRMAKEDDDHRVLPVSLSSGSLLDDYSKWRDDAATSNGIHRISSHSDNLQRLNHSYPQGISYDPARSNLSFLSDDSARSPLTPPTRSPYPTGTASDLQNGTSQPHMLLGRR